MGACPDSPGCGLEKQGATWPADLLDLRNPSCARRPARPDVDQKACAWPGSPSANNVRAHLAVGADEPQLMIPGFERSRQIGKHKWVVTLIVPPARAPW